MRGGNADREQSMPGKRHLKKSMTVMLCDSRSLSHSNLAGSFWPVETAYFTSVRMGIGKFDIDPLKTGSFLFGGGDTGLYYHTRPLFTFLFGFGFG
jgi:hypothetical protein